MFWLILFQFKYTVLQYNTTLNIPDKKRNTPGRTVQLSGRSRVIGQFSYISGKVCQVLLRYTSFVTKRQKCDKENWS